MVQKKYNLEEIGHMFETYIKYRRNSTTINRLFYETAVPFEVQKKIKEVDTDFKKSLRLKLE